MLTDEMRYRLMRALQENPQMSQRDIARALGVSLGRVNYCLQALVSRGLVKVKNFSNNDNKSAYIYLLTPRGIREKASITLRFLEAKLLEYDNLRMEIKQIRRDSERDQQRKSG